MLNEQVLEELARNTPLQQTMVETAWPSLSSESRLQVIQAVQGPAIDGTPTWLMELCISDPAPIVRYWAARRYQFPTSAEQAATGPFAAFLPPPPENEQLLRAKASADHSELVRACVADDPWDASVPTNRLVFARNKSSAHLVCGLHKAFEAGMSSEAVAETLREVLCKPQVQADLKFNGEYQEGDTAYHEGQIVKDGWALVRKAGPDVQWLLAGVLPTSRGLGHITPQELATLPGDALEAMAYRQEKTKEISQALDLVLSNPEKYDEKTIRSINYGFESCSGANSPHRGSPSVDRGKETLEQIQVLQGQVQELAEQLNALRQLATAKKGWFS